MPLQWLCDNVLPHMRISAHTCILIWDAHMHMGQHLVPYKYELQLARQLHILFCTLYFFTCRLIVSYCSSCCCPCWYMHGIVRYCHVYAYGTVPYAYTVAVGWICIWDYTIRIQCIAAAQQLQYTRMGLSHMRMHGTIEQSHAYTSMDCPIC